MGWFEDNILPIAEIGVAVVIAVYAPELGLSAGFANASALTLGSYAINSYTRDRALKAAKNAADAAAAAATPNYTAIRSAEAPRKTVYGQTRVSGPYLYGTTTGSKNEYMHLIVALASHEIDSVVEYWLNDASVGPLDANGFVQATLPGGAANPWYKNDVQLATEVINLDGNGQGNTQHPISAFLHATTQDATGLIDVTSRVASQPGGTQVSIAVPHAEPTPVTGLFVTILYTSEAGPVVETGTLDANGNVSVTQQILILQSITTQDDTGLISLKTRATFAGNVVNVTALPGVANGIASITVQYNWQAGGPMVQFRSFTGSPDQAADSVLIGLTAGQAMPWTAACRLRGVAYMIVRLQADSTIFASGVPNPSAVIRGKKLFDPRSGQTVWSDNWALAVRDYLTNVDYGLRCDDREIDDAAITTAANACDEIVPTATASQKRYTVNGVFSWEDDKRSVLGSLRDSAMGSIVDTGGIWRVRAGVYEAPVAGLGPDDFTSDPMTMTAWAARSDLFNSVRGKYSSFADSYTVTDYPQYKSQVYIGEDFEVLWKDLDFDYIDDAARAQRVAKLFLQRARQCVTFTASCKQVAYPLEVGDRVTLTLADFGWDAKVFEIVERTCDPNGVLTFTFVEDAPAFYAWDFDEARDPDPSPNTNLPSLRTVQPLTNLTVTTGTSIVRVLNDGTVIPRARVSWDLSSDSSVRNGGQIIIQWLRGDESTFATIAVPGDETETFIEPVAAGELLIIRGAAQNALGSQSGWWYVNDTVDESTPANSQGSNTGNTHVGLGINLLENASLRTSEQPWILYAGAADQAVIAWIPPGQPGSPGVYGAVHVQALGALTDFDSNVNTVKRAVPCQPGQRFEYQSRIKNYRGNARILAGFLDVSGAVMYGAYIGLSGGPGATTTDSLGYTGTLAESTLLWGFADVPAGAVATFLTVQVSRNSTATSTDIFVMLPFLGQALPKQTEPSNWVDGTPTGDLANYDRAAASGGTQTATGFFGNYPTDGATWEYLITETATPLERVTFAFDFGAERVAARQPSTGAGLNDTISCNVLLQLRQVDSPNPDANTIEVIATAVGSPSTYVGHLNSIQSFFNTPGIGGSGVRIDKPAGTYYYALYALGGDPAQLTNPLSGISFTYNVTNPYVQIHEAYR